MIPKECSTVDGKKRTSIGPSESKHKKPETVSVFLNDQRSLQEVPLFESDFFPLRNHLRSAHSYDPPLRVVFLLIR